jgi:hypothetical protein
MPAPEVLAALNPMRALGAVARSRIRPLTEIRRAQLSIALFCNRLARALLGLMTALSSIDALIFTGGIGENNASIRAQVLTDLARRGISFVGRDGLRAVPFFFWSWHPVSSRTVRRPSCLEKRNVSASLSFGGLLFKTSIAYELAGAHDPGD